MLLIEVLGWAAALLCLTGLEPTLARAAIQMPLAQSSSTHGPSGDGLSVPLASGKFSNSILPARTGRDNGPFWDNVSDDAFGSAQQCNIGYFAVGAMSPGCLHATPGSFANQGGFEGGTYLGVGLRGRNPSDFLFNGGPFAVTLVGSFAGAESTVGWFTRDSGYAFRPVPGWINKVIGHTEVIDREATGDLSWGLYVENGSINVARGCDPAHHRSCSDAVGGYLDPPYNQFALFRNAAGTRVLVGAEDNILEVAPVADSDYNDYIWIIQPATDGCTFTPEYWKDADQSPEWPVPSLMLGTRKYSAAAARSILIHSAGGNDLAGLARELIAAKLNQANGARVPAGVLTAMTAAGAAIGAQMVPPGGAASASSGELRGLAATLAAYNAGDTGPGHCASERPF
jgi:hypothetical protein